jgi:heat-inducible transcriptional repressor
MRTIERRNAILRAIIEQYIGTGEPVPSARIARVPELGLSSASVRGAMAELTDGGYLEQPHISAGRVPTAKAFRLYVDAMLTPRALPMARKSAIDAALAAGDTELSQILRRASGMVSNYCCQLGVVLAPRRDESLWRSIEFAPVGPGLVLAVLILDGGSVRTRLVEIAEAYSQDELIRFGNYLNDFFKGRTLAEARLQMQAELAREGAHLEAMCRRALTLSRAAVAGQDEEREIFVDGAAQVAYQTEFADAARLRGLLSLLEEKSRLLDLLDRTMKSADIAVSFHDEGGNAPAWAVVSALYVSARNGEGPAGVVSAVGPLRMDYAAVLPVVAHIAETVAAILRRRFAE